MTSGDLLFSIAGLWAVALASFALWRRPRTLISSSFACGMILFATDAVLSGAAYRASSPRMVGQLELWRLMVTTFLPALWLPFSLTYSRGNHREFIRKWRLTLVAVALLPVVAGVMWSRLFELVLDPTDPAGRPALRLLWGGHLVQLGFLIAVVLILMNLERTLRAAVGTLRWRIKYAVVGLILLFAVRFYTSSQQLSFATHDLSLSYFDASALVLACLLVTVSFWRTSLSGTQVYPSLAVLQHSFVVLLAGIYLLVVGLLAKVAVLLGGDRAFPLTSFVVLLSFVALSLAVISERTRFFGRRWISRHFRRPLYDYRGIWRHFGERTSSIVDERAYCRELVNLISETLRVLTVTAWLVDEGRGKLRLVASTSLPANSPQPGAPGTPPQKALGPEAEDEIDAAVLAPALTTLSEPFALDDCPDTWVAELKRRNPVQFMTGGGRACVPLAGKGQWLGLLVIGDRVNGVPLSVEDFELLKSFGDHAANGLLNLQLAQRLFRAREMEAFQSMAAFFVHDLKNTASSLSLMLQNLPHQMENPAFRQDALRAVGKSVTRLNDLIARLSQIRENVGATRVETQMQPVIQAAIDAVGAMPDIKLVSELEPTPAIEMDADQIQKVITNLLINAREAINTATAGGEIRVRSTREQDWLVVTVSDNGCGISPEFLARSLFRPFQTTKKAGIGIGMFQCKTIVEAHRGRIEVESQPGKGTTFRVLLPVTTGGVQ